MTDHRNPLETEADGVTLALNAYQARFGSTIPFAWIAAFRSGEVTALLQEAIRNGRPINDEDIRLALGMPVPSPGTDTSRLAVAINSYRDRFSDTPWAIDRPDNTQSGWFAAIRHTTPRDKGLTANDKAGVTGRIKPLPGRSSEPPTFGLSPSADCYEALNWTVKVYADQFGKGPSVYQFLGWPAALAREILAAVECGERLTRDNLQRRLGMTPPPASAII